MHRITVLLFLFIPFGAWCQSAEQDTVNYASVYKWVERKITFNYFDPTNQNWWINRINKNEDGSVTIMNIAAKHPDKVLEKVYHLRRLFLYDINPNAITIIETANDQGRFVKGKIVRLGGFGDEQKIATKKDGIVGSMVSFLHISVPQFLEDSLENYTNELKYNLSKLVFLDARLTNARDEKKNKEAVFSALRGSYVNKDSTSYLSFEVTEPGHVRFEWRSGDKRSYGQIGFDQSKKTYFFFRSSANEFIFREFVVDATASDLILVSDLDRIHVIGRNTIDFFIDGKKEKFFRY